MLVVNTRPPDTPWTNVNLDVGFTEGFFGNLLGVHSQVINNFGPHELCKDVLA